jgi:hypothetical protein
VFVYGAPGWIPVVGDWNGSGTTTIGVVDPATMTWRLRDLNSPGAPDIAPFRFGAPGWVPVVGDWNGDGVTSVGAIDPQTGVWYLRNENSAGPPDAGTFAFGLAGWRHLAGHWSPLAAPELAAGALARASPAGGAARAGPLTDEALRQTVAAALTRLGQAGVDANLIARLRAASYEVAPLSGGTLGYTYARARTVVIDQGAAGYGWFFDPTPLADEEFGPVDGGELAALPGSPAAGRMDLLTVVLHEMGHLAGRRDLHGQADSDTLMADALAPGQRRTEALDAVFATSNPAGQAPARNG